MLNVRSRTGVAGVASGAAVLLALPVVAAGQVPGVDQVVGGVTGAVGTVSQLPAPPPAPVSLPAPAPAPAPVAQPAPPVSAPAPALPAPAASAPAASPRGTGTATPSNGSGSSATTPAASSGGGPGADDAGTRGGARPHASQDAGAPEDEGDIPPASDTPSDQPGGADDTGGGANGSAGGETGDPGDNAGDTGSAGDDAGPAELPFTGLELALLAMIGLATAASGTVMRRAA
jgi:hypothetical protein